VRRLLYRLRSDAPLNYVPDQFWWVLAILAAGAVLKLAGCLD